MTTRNTVLLSITAVVEYLVIKYYRNTPRFAVSYGIVWYRTVPYGTRRTPKATILKMSCNPWDKFAVYDVEEVDNDDVNYVQGVGEDTFSGCGNIKMVFVGVMLLGI